MASLALLAIGCVALGAFLVRGLAGPLFVDDLTVTNPTEYSIDVRVSGGDDSWLGLGAVGPGEERSFREVIDQGDAWILEFSYAGALAGHVEIEREALAEGGWRVEVPVVVGRALADRGFTAPPRGS